MTHAEVQVSHQGPVTLVSINRREARNAVDRITAQQLADAFRGLLIPQDQATPKLHITIQNKVEPPVAKALHAHLLGSFRPRALAISGLSAHYYRDGPWELIGRWSFRG